MANPRRPTPLRKLEGNPGKRPLPPDEPKPKACAPRAPAHLSEDAKKHWRTVVKQLHAAKVMSRLDVDALAMYCEAYTRWVDANEHIRDEGMIIIYENGIPGRNPYLKISDDAFAQMHKMLNEFGMTPAARGKVAVIKDDSANADPWAKV